MAQTRKKKETEEKGMEAKTVCLPPLGIWGFFFDIEGERGREAQPFCLYYCTP